MPYRAIKRNVKSVALAALIAGGAAGIANAADMPLKAVPLKPVPFFFVNDTSVSFTWYPASTDPGVAGSSAIVGGGIAGQKNTFNRYQFSIDHFDVWQYGTNLIHGEFNQYGDQDPNLGVPGSNGAREFFGFWTGTLGFNELSGTKEFSTVLTKDVSFMLNLTGGVENDYLSEETTQIAPGIQFALNLPGVVNVGIAAYKEYTHNNFDACGPAAFGVALNGTCVGGGSFNGDREFEWTWKLFTFMSEPLTFLPPSMPITFENVLNVTGPKGTGISAANCVALGCSGSLGAFANNESKTEVFEDARLSLDASKVFWNKPGIWDAYVGYRYWYNKFGTNHNAALFASIAPDTSIESTAYLGTTYHFK
ncbi:MAG TPA: hypothetical protein VMF12_16130 [Xanthobacteraceae bacterium]|nr:hypothetical protein [Xanthobacteraceae bacterium]